MRRHVPIFQVSKIVCGLAWLSVHVAEWAEGDTTVASVAISPERTNALRDITSAPPVRDVAFPSSRLWELPFPTRERQ